MQAAKELSDQWNLTRIGEDPVVDVWMADVSHYVFKILVKVKVMNNLESNFTIHVYNLIIFNFAVMCKSQWDEINNTLNTHALGIGSTNLNPLDLFRDNTTMKDV